MNEVLSITAVLVESVIRDDQKEPVLSIKRDEPCIIAQSAILSTVIVTAPPTTLPNQKQSSIASFSCWDQALSIGFAFSLSGVFWKATVKGDQTVAKQLCRQAEILTQLLFLLKIAIIINCFKFSLLDVPQMRTLERRPKTCAKDNNDAIFVILCQ